MQGQVEDVDADVDGRAAAGDGLVDEAQALGQEAAAQELGAGVVDFAKHAGLEVFLEAHAVVLKPHVLGRHQDPVLGAVARGDHVADLLGRHGQRLLAEHVQAVAERLDGDGSVASVVGADVDGVKLRAGLEYVGQIGEAGLFGQADLIAAAMSALLDGVGAGDDAAVGG